MKQVGSELKEELYSEFPEYGNMRESTKCGRLDSRDFEPTCQQRIVKDAPIRSRSARCPSQIVNRNQQSLGIDSEHFKHPGGPKEGLDLDGGHPPPLFD